MLYFNGLGNGELTILTNRVGFNYSEHRLGKDWLRWDTKIMYLDKFVLIFVGIALSLAVIQVGASIDDLRRRVSDLEDKIDEECDGETADRCGEED